MVQKSLEGVAAIVFFLSFFSLLSVVFKMGGVQKLRLAENMSAN